MVMTNRKPATVGELLTDEFMQPRGLTQAALAEFMGVQRRQPKTWRSRAGECREQRSPPHAFVFT